MARPEGRATTAGELSALIAALENLGALKNLDAVITGYFATPEQIEIVARLITKLNSKIILIDPVMGDHGKLYVAEPVAMALRDHLLPLATITTPNAFELSWLTSLPVINAQTAITAGQKLKIDRVIVTSVPNGETALDTILVQNNNMKTYATPRLAHVPHGIGDMLAGLYLAGVLNNPDTALEKALAILNRAIALSEQTQVLAVAEALYESRLAK